MRGSYSKTDHTAPFMRVKRDYRGNDQLLPAYNMQMVGWLVTRKSAVFH